MTDVLNLIFSQEFLIRALIVGILISLCSALLGVSLVLKRFSMIGDGLSHVGFGAMAIACAANVAPLYFALPIVVIAAFLLLRISESGKIKGDAAIALISTGALAVGVMVTSMTTGMNVDIYNYMFGSILTMSDSDVLISCILSAVVIVLFVIFYDEIFAVTFDESFAKATGTKTNLYNMLIASLTAVTIVIGMRMMGALLISSLIIFPTVTSTRLCKSFRKVIFASIMISVFCFISGLLLSIKYEAPTGAAVVCVNIFVFIAFSILRYILEKNYSDKVIFKRIFLSVTVLFFASVYLITMFSGEMQFYAKEKTTIVTTTFAPYDFARNIAGDKAETVMLLSPGEESHTYEPTPKDIMEIKECDVFVYGGGESEKWVDSILQSLDSDIKTVKMMDVVELYEETLEDGMEEDETHSHSHDEHNEHSEEYDEHVWTSPLNAIEITKSISAAVIEADSKNKDYYSDNTEKYIDSLKALDAYFNQALADCKREYIVIGDRFPLRYLTERYGIDYYAAFPGCSAQVEANPVTIAFLTEKVNDENVPIVFKVDLSSGNVAYSISNDTGAKVETLYSCHVISADDFNNGEGYISLMQRNIESLKKALK